MAKEYMVGTLGDYPLLKVTVNGIRYFLDEKKKEVFLDAPKLPRVKDEETINAVLKAAQ